MIELPLDSYGDAAGYRECCQLAETYRNIVLTPLYYGRRIYVTACYIEGDGREGLLMAVCEQTPCDCGKCARGECDPAQQYHYDGGYIRSHHSQQRLESEETHVP